MADTMTQAHSDIPFNRAALVGNEWKYLAETVRMGHIAGDGFYTLRCHDFIEKGGRSRSTRLYLRLRRQRLRAPRRKASLR